MPSAAAEILARLRVCRDAAIAVPDDLRDEAIFYLEQAISTPRLRVARDSYIRQAALLLPQGSIHSHATALQAEAARLGRSRSAQPPSALTCPRECLQAAALCAPLPQSRRQYLRLLQASAL